MIDNLLSEAEWAKKRRTSLRTVQRERTLRIGPPFIRLGRKVFYRPEAIEEWLLAREESQVRAKGRAA